MADIKLTLSTERRKRSASFAHEARRLKEYGELGYPVHGFPRRDPKWVYFVRDGMFVGRARYERAEEGRTSNKRINAAGDSEKPGRVMICVVPNAEPIEPPVTHGPGFQSFRYMTPAEQRRCDAALVRSKRAGTTRRRAGAR